MHLPPPQAAALRRFGRQLVMGNLAVLALVMLTAALGARGSWLGHEDRARVNGSNLAQTLSLDVAAVIKQADTLLLSTLNQLERLEGRGAPDGAEVARIANAERELMPSIVSLRVTDAEGRFLNGGPDEASVAGRDFFEIARADPRQLAVSEPMAGRAPNEWTITLARARFDAEGRFNGIVLAALTSERFHLDFQRADVGTLGAVTLRSAGLALISRYAPKESLAQAARAAAKVPATLNAALAAQPERGSFLSRAYSDTQERLTTYERVPGTNLLLLVDLAAADYRAGWWRDLAGLLGLLAALEAMVVGLSVAVYRVQVSQARALAKIDLLATERGVLLDNELVGMFKLRNRNEVWHNKAMAKLFGYEPGELSGQPSRRLYPDEASYDLVGRGYQQLASTGSFRTQLQMVRKDGQLLWIDLSGTPLPNGESLWLLVDISAVKASEEQALQQALHDDLTGLANRHLLLESLDFMLLNAERQSGRLAVCCLDLDGYNAVNDEQGHAGGDQVLRVAAQRLLGCVRSNDLVARLGGAQFVVVLNQLDTASDEQQVLQRMVSAFEAPVPLPEGASAPVGLSIGVAVYPEHGRRGAELLKLADRAMLRCKRAALGAWLVHEPTMPEA